MYEAPVSRLVPVRAPGWACHAQLLTCIHCERVSDISMKFTAAMTVCMSVRWCGLQRGKGCARGWTLPIAAEHELCRLSSQKGCDEIHVTCGARALLEAYAKTRVIDRGVLRVLRLMRVWCARRRRLLVSQRGMERTTPALTA